MRRVATLLTLLLASGAALAGHSSTSDGRHGRDRDHDRGRDTIWVTNRDQGTFMVFDARTGEAETPVPLAVGTGAHDLVVSKRAGKAFVMNELEHTVAVRSASTFELLDTIPLGPRPHHTKLSTDGKTVYVGLFGTNRIAAIDARTHAVREFASSELPGPMAHAPRPSFDGRFVFVPHETGNLITKLSARTGAFLGSLAPGDTPVGQPSEILPTRDGETLYVSMRNEGKIKSIDGDRFVLNGSVEVGPMPESLMLTPDECTLILSLRGTPAQLALVDTETLTLRETIAIGGPGTNGDLAVLSPDGRFVYATFDMGIPGQGGIAKVDLHRRTVQTWTYPGTGRPHGIAYSTTRLRGLD